MAKIIIYVHDFRTSGVVKDSLMLAGHCAQSHEVTLVAGYGGGFLEEEARSGGYAVHVLHTGTPRAPSRLRAAPALRRWLKTQGKCVIVSMGNMGHATPYWASRGLPHVRKVYRISNEIKRADGLRGRMRTIWMRRLIADADCMPLVGAALSANPLFADALHRGVAIQMASGVDSASAQEMARAPAPHPWLEDTIPVVLGIGRLRPQKNFGLLIEAAGLLRRERNLRLVILGNGSAEEQASLQQRATDNGLAGSFLLAGETDNVFSWLSRAAAFALPSRWEGSSVALLEAMAVGTPVIASRLAGDAAEVLEHGRYGLVFDGESASALAAAIARQLSDDAVKPGARAEHYPPPWGRYRTLIEGVVP